MIGFFTMENVIQDVKVLLGERRWNHLGLFIGMENVMTCIYRVNHDPKDSVRFTDGGVTLLRVPGHCGVEGNEKDDELAESVSG